MSEDDTNVIDLTKRQKEMAAEFDRAKAKPKKNKPKKKDEQPPFYPPPPPPFLPPDAPVKCLGHLGLHYYFLDAVGQVIMLEAKEISRNNILAIFGGDDYLIVTFPSYDKHGNRTGEWKHGELSPILIKTCQMAGLWNPRDKVRDVGCWVEDDGTLVFHCGDILVTSRGRTGTGLRGKLVYPTAPKLPEPILDAPAGDGARHATPNWGPEEWATVEGPAARVMERLVTWHYARQFIDPVLILGDICCAMLGAAPGWRPMMLVTGESRTGKSTLLGGLKAIIGTDAFISSGNATQAAVARLVGQTTKPVFLDEMERNYNSTRADELIELLILASSGETLDRGTPGAETNSFVARNCFVLSAINLPGLKQQVLNRVFVIELGLLDSAAPARLASESKDVAKDQVEEVWGSRAMLERLGRELRGRLLGQWPRYQETLFTYRRELFQLGHDRRSADQFGSALTAYDLVMFDDVSEQRAKALASWLLASKTAEVAENLSHQQQYINWLLQLKVAIGARGGRQMTISKLVRRARADVEGSVEEDQSDARTALTQIGFRTFRHSGGKPYDSNNQAPRWIVAIATEHAGLAELLVGTPWHMRAGSTSGWTDMLRRLPGAEMHNPETGRRRRIRIDGRLTYVVFIPWETLFNEEEFGDDDGQASVMRWSDSDRMPVAKGET
jgi:hypothetical protein